ncbi:MAG: hypothetical protein V1809_12975 [Planctomycetota bacterium]
MDTFDAASSSGSASVARRMALPVLLAAALALLHFALLQSFFEPAVTPADENGYYATAKALVTMGRFHTASPDEFSFVGNMRVRNDRGEYYAKYPPGFPLLLSSVWQTLGLDAAFWVNPVASALVIFLMFFILFFFFCRMADGVSENAGPPFSPVSLATLGTLILAANPSFAIFGVSQMSHPVALFFQMGGLLAAAAGFFRRSRLLAFAGGLFLGYGVAIRYADGLLLVPFAALTAWQWWKERRFPEGALSFALGAMLPLAFLAVYHGAAFGGPFRSGYALTEEQTGFGFGYLVKSGPVLLGSIFYSGIGIFAALAMPGLALLWKRRREEALVAGLWVVPLVAIYAFYYWAPDDRPYRLVRFVLAAYPFFAALGLFLLAELPLSKRSGRAVILGITALVLFQEIPHTLQNLRETGDRNRNVRLMAELAQKRLPPESVLIAEEQFLGHLDIMTDFRLYPRNLFQPGAGKRAKNQAKATGPRGLQRERAQDLAKILPDRPPAEARKFLKDFLKGHLAAGRTVAVLTPRPDEKNIQNQLSPEYKATELGMVRVPIFPPPPPEAEERTRELVLFQISALPKRAWK